MTLVAPLNQGLRRVPTWLVYGAGAVPSVWLFYLAMTGGLGVEPVERLEHAYGELALQLFVVTLAITPLRRYVGLNLLKFRRALGLLTFFYVLAHLLVWAVLDVQTVDRIWVDILKRPYITIGMLGFACLLPLALTSNNWSVRHLGPSWHSLHKLTFVAAILGAVHFVMLAKGFQIEPLVYLGVIVALLASRLPKRRKLATSRSAT